MCAVQFSPSTYILLLYTHAHVYISNLSGRNVRPPMFIFHQTTEIRNYFSVYILSYHAALHARNSFRAGFFFFFYDRFNRKVFTYYYYHRMCTIRISSCTIILYRSLQRSAKSHHQISSCRKSCSCFACGACSLRIVFRIKIKYIM